ncbi:MAG: hypothetical protein ABI185_11645, partial [Ginsengibacter sp.]
MFLLGCKKDHVISGTSNISSSFLDSAKQYLRLTLSQNDFDNLDFAKGKVLVYKNQNVGVQIF